jgi:pimeloyl-ACP methyl ester carboxylesterase
VTNASDEFIDLPGRPPDHHGSLRFHYRDWGGEGRTVLLLHGLSSNARIWDLMAPHLCGHLRVIAVDQRGHGLSDKPDNGYTFQDVGGDLAALIEALTLERPLIVGHSWGGNVALQFATDRPDQVRGLVLVDGGFLEITAMDGMTWERTQEVMAPPPLEGMKLEDFQEAARRRPDGLWNEQTQEVVLANFEVTADGTIHPHLARANHMKILRSAWEQKPSRLWERLRCPALLVPAAHRDPDPGTAMWMKAKGKSIDIARERSPLVEVFWMRDTIHDVPLQRPRELAELIAEFAASLP